MQGIDPLSIKDMSKLRNVNEADEFLREVTGQKDQDAKGEFHALKEVEDLKALVTKQEYLLHAMWILLKEKGITNEQLDKALNEAVLLEKRKDFKNTTECPNCGKGLQSMENLPFTLKCYYCGTEVMGNPFKKYDGLDPYKTDYPENTGLKPEPYVSDDEADKQELKEAQDVISQSFEPYDVTKDLGFDEET